MGREELVSLNRVAEMRRILGDEINNKYHNLINLNSLGFIKVWKLKCLKYYLGLLFIGWGVLVKHNV